MLWRVLLPARIVAPGVLSRGLLLRLPASVHVRMRGQVRMRVPAGAADLPLRLLLHVDYVLGLPAACSLPPGVLLERQCQCLHPVPGGLLLR